LEEALPLRPAVALLLLAPCGSVFAQGVVQVPADAPTLTAAIAAVADGGIIEMAGGTYVAPPGGFVISNLPKRFTIRAAEGATVVLSGGGTRDIMRFVNTSLATGRPVVFERLTFSGGVSTTDFVAGAVTMARADATFVSCIFANNVANPPIGGGGAVWIDGSRVFFHGVTWMNNSSRNFGGGLVVFGTTSRVYIHASVFLNNRTNLPGHAGNATGGAIHLHDATLRVTNTRFEGNQAGYVGGAIYALGTWTDPVGTPRADLLVANSTFVNNHAARDPSVSFPDPAVGGAIHVEDQTTARFHNSRFVDNSARQGGAISTYRALVEVEGGTFQGNQTSGTGLGEGLGGAIIALSTDNNDASTGFGTINRRSTELTVRETVFHGRFGGAPPTARQGGCIFAGGDVNAAYGLGGVTQNGTPASNRAAVGLFNVALVDCDVMGGGGLGGFGGALLGSLVALTQDDSVVINSDASDSGGALALLDEYSAVLNRTMFARNTAVTSGGALYVLGGNLAFNEGRLVHNALTSGNSGSAMLTFPDPGGFGKPAVDVTGAVQSSVISSNTGPAAFQVLDGDANSPPVNRLQYNANHLFPNNTSLLFNSLAGPRDVVGLNALVVTRSGASSTDKAPLNDNVGPASAPVVGSLLAVPPERLPVAAAGDPAGPTAAYLAYAWSGGSATLNGSPRVGNSGLEAAAGPGLYTLSVAGNPVAATVADGPLPDTTLSANPPVVVGGGSSLLSWSTNAGTFLEQAIDQGVSITSSASGSVSVSPGATTTYRAFLVTEEGGAVDAVTVFGDGIFRDGFE
jgi:predicted outer membrane repeat protein